MLNHLAIIMDGNGRWAKQRQLQRSFGHQQGKENVEAIISACSERGIKTLSLFVFSTENWKRPKLEVSLLMRLIEKGLLEKKEALLRQNIRINFIGARENLPLSLQNLMVDLEALSAQNSGMRLVLAINFSGSWAMIETTKNLLKAGINPENLDNETYQQYRPLADLPPVDLLIRTSGEQRLSNFYLWESAYAELFFTAVHWPDFSVADLDDALSAYAQRNRRFGRV